LRVPRATSVSSARSALRSDISKVGTELDVPLPNSSFS
jgi:hypothetical protein